MCGITGLVNINDKVLLHDMCNCLVHRGPDSSGFFEDNGIGLGIRRLSIIDVEGGDQPIQNEEGNIWTIFNGEIYNYREIKQDLVSKGHKFRTNSDTETIVHAYEQYGLDFVQHLRGMFAIAIRDGKKKKTILVRDRLGIKPLYYIIRKNQLLFASELKVLLEYEDIKPTINRNAISDYLTYLYVPAPDTIFNEIRKMMPGEILVFDDDGTYATRPYWDIHFENNESSLDSCVKQLHDLLEESIKLRLVSDVPVGVLLSSGLDSATVATLAAKTSPHELSTYTVGFQDFEDRSYDELKGSKEMAEFLGTNHKEIIVNSNDALKLLDRVTWYLDEPFGNPTTTLHYIISEFASKTSKVVISGVGGDEMFGGYPKYRALKIFEDNSKIPLSFIKALSTIFQKLPEKSETVVKGKRFFEAWQGDSIDQYLSLVSCFTEKEKQDLLTFQPNSSRKIVDNLAKEAEIKGANNFFQKMFYIECKSYLPNNILEYTDKTSMAVSLEVREPLLDHRIVEFSANLPFGFKIKNGSMKHILKLAMKNDLPKSVLNRKKRGFTPPLINWLNNSLSDLESQYISKERLSERKLLNYSYVKGLIDGYKQGKKSNYVKIWNIICLESWFNTFMQKYNISV